MTVCEDTSRYNHAFHTRPMKGKHPQQLLNRLFLFL